MATFVFHLKPFVPVPGRPGFFTYGVKTVEAEDVHAAYAKLVPELEPGQEAWSWHQDGLTTDPGSGTTGS